MHRKNLFSIVRKPGFIFLPGVNLPCWPVFIPLKVFNAVVWAPPIVKRSIAPTAPSAAGESKTRLSKSNLVLYK